jgi:hypothetical protein
MVRWLFKAKFVYKVTAKGVWKESVCVGGEVR